MSFWNSVHVKKTKKEYGCEFCGCKIISGSSCYHETGKADGDFCDYRLCERCRYLLYAHSDIFMDDGYLGDFFDCFRNTDLLDCPICGKCNLREFDFSEDMLSIEIECNNCDHKHTVDLSIGAIDKVLGGNET